MVSSTEFFPVRAKCAICGQIGDAADYWYDALSEDDDDPLCPACMADIVISEHTTLMPTAERGPRGAGV